MEKISNVNKWIIQNKFWIILLLFCDYGSREYSQKKHFGAKYSISDILLTTLGGVLAIGLVHFFT